MRIARLVAVTVLFAAVLSLAACSHQLVGHNGEATISVFPNKDDFDKVMSMKSEGGAAGMLGGVGESMMAKRVPQGSHIKILTSDSEGAQVEVLDGPNAGLRGYVSKDNLD